MLEVLHLTKIYKTKGGAEVRALDDVSLKFPERGMIFLLGKSGSGKSTLLNVAGGLDDPSGGEIIVKGRSSKSFTQGDFDSYRNTFIGFIFQEYNILNEFSVEDNIAIALELQGKPKDREAITRLLEEVDLTGYAKRKPNTLSGGQKQRIAIARALIKSPEIIMADEPTGALDSATGKQVFDTLKKLSRDKLVIIVSHDRDFAEQYADRIIELKDGKVLSDVSKTEEERREISENITSLGDTLTVKSGAELTEEDFLEIKEFLKGAKRDVVIATGERDLKTFREAARITEDGKREVFRDTDTSVADTKVFSPEDSKFIRSRLPLKHAVKIGVSGLKTKPIRLAFTALLCTVAFIMFGILSTMMLYDSDATLRQTLKDSALDVVSLQKRYEYTNRFYSMGELENEYTGEQETPFTKADLDEITEIYGDAAFGSVSLYHTFNVQQQSSKYYRNYIYGASYLAQSHPMRSDIIHGSYPANDDEAMITSYTAEVMMNSKLYDAVSGDPLNVTDIREIVGKYFSLDGTKYKISGIIEAPALPAQYEVLKNAEDNSYTLEYQLETELRGGYYTNIFLTETALKRILDKQSYGSMYEIFYNRDVTLVYKQPDGGYPEFETWANGRYTGVSAANGKAEIIWLGGKSELSRGEALLPIAGLYDILITEAEDKLRSSEGELEDAKRDIGYESKVNDLLREMYHGDRELIENNRYKVINWEYGAAEDPASEDYRFYLEWRGIMDAVIEKTPSYGKYSRIKDAAEMLRNNGYFKEVEDGISEFVMLTDSERRAFLDTVIPFIPECDAEKQFKFELYNNSSSASFGDTYFFTTAGYYIPSGDIDYNSALLSDAEASELWEIQKATLEWCDETVTDFVPEEGAIYSTVYVPFGRTDAEIDRIIEIHNNKSYGDNHTRTVVRCSLIDGFVQVDSMVTQLSKIFLWVGIVVAGFAALLMSNFISVSISQKKREIGILRAVGARGIDVFKIFFSESFTIAAICTLISTVASIVLCGVLNAEISATIGSSLFVFGALSVAMLIGIALATAVVATFLPVYNAARKKPVESIRAL